MRRLWLGVLLGFVLLTGTACDSNETEKVTKRDPIPSPAGSPAASAERKSDPPGKTQDAQQPQASSAADRPDAQKGQEKQEPAADKSVPSTPTQGSSTAPAVPATKDDVPPNDTPQVAPTDEIASDSPLPPLDPNWTRMDPEQEIWIDAEKKRVVVGGQICLRRGQLEMFACPRHTKEHESVVVVHTRPELIHASLLSLDINPGKPVQYEPEFKAAEGPEVEILVRWMADSETREVRSQEMIRTFRDKKVMDMPWVFGGSVFFEEPNSGKRVYAANHGSLVCVSNFPDAMIDVPVQSSDVSGQLLFEANTEKIPALGTRVLLIIHAAPKK